MLKLVVESKKETIVITAPKTYGPEAMSHHSYLLEGYLQSHKIRNHSPKTISESKRVLTAWFDMYGSDSRPLYVWEAMECMHGRNRIVNYGKLLLESEVATQTVRQYIGILRGFFSYVLEHPYVFIGERAIRISDHYNSIEQPVSEFDIPAHVFDGDQKGVPFDPSRLYDFYAVLRKNYLTPGRGYHLRARNYAMVVLAGESGLRADEVNHIETDRDLFFESKKLQTRWAKSTTGSGKRTRVTLFTPLARDTIRFYLNHHRPYLIGAKDSSYLFPSRSDKTLSYTAMWRGMEEMKVVSNKNNFTVCEHMSWHWLRRLFATRFIERFPHQLSVLVDLLGHVTPNTIHKYIRHSEAWMDQKILEVLEGIEMGNDPLEA
jgi:site-specific recombinase XerD